MDVKEAIVTKGLKIGDVVDLSGWLVDIDGGLYVLGDHYPENYAHSYRVKIQNDDIIYPILCNIPALVGGRSSLFYRSKLNGQITSLPSLDFECFVCGIQIESVRGSGIYHEIDVSPETVRTFVEKFGKYGFEGIRDSMRDWLDDV